MQCPFPGMDPYIERSALWGDFHLAMIAEIRGLLQPLLRPKYVALAQGRLYVVETRRPIYPDVAVVRASSRRDGKGGVATIDVAKPALFEVVEEEIRQPYLHIIEPAAGNRLITAIEVLSPDNKSRGIGRREYMKKRVEVRRARANLVEIDLLRTGKPTLRVSADDLAELKPWRYLVGILRRPNMQEVYPIPLQAALPTIAIPLRRKDAAAPLDLQAAFALAWQKGPYPAVLNYDSPPPGSMTPEEIAWCERRLREAGFRPKPTSSR